MHRTLKTTLGVLCAATALVGCRRNETVNNEAAAPAATPAPAESTAAMPAAPTQAMPGQPGAVTLQVSTAPGVGTFVTDGNGQALWILEKDTPTKSECTGPCLNAWAPVLVVGQPTLGSGEAMNGATQPATGTPEASNPSDATGKATGQLDQSKLSTLQRADGTMQATYNGHPLYFHASGAAAGTANATGANATSAATNPNGTAGNPGYATGTSATNAAPPTKAEIHDQFGTWYLITPDGKKDEGKSGSKGS